MKGRAFAATRRDFLTGTAATLACATGGCLTAAGDMDGNLTVLLSDIHLCGNDELTRWLYTRRELAARVETILAMRPRPARVVCFGDLAFNSGDPRDYALAKTIMQPLADAGIRVVHGMGNHDCRPHFLAHFPEYAKTSPVAGRIVSELDLGTCDLVLLDSLEGDSPDSGGKVSGELNKAMQEYVADTLPMRTRPFLVGAHHTVYELYVGKRRILTTLKESPMCVGWIHGHNHNWVKDPLVSWGESNQDTIRSLCLPSAGLWGDIGLVALRAESDQAVAVLHQSGYWFNDAPHPDERTPETWQAIVDENRGQFCRFPFERTLRK